MRFSGALLLFEGLDAAGSVTEARIIARITVDLTGELVGNHSAIVKIC